jgi:hypothetical protein
LRRELYKGCFNVVNFFGKFYKDVLFSREMDEEDREVRSDSYVNHIDNMIRENEKLTGWAFVGFVVGAGVFLWTDN